MYKILNTNQFKGTLLALIMAFVPCWTALGFFQIPSYVYPIFLVGYFLLFLGWTKRIDGKFCIILFTIFCSCLLATPLPIFKMWMRFANLSLILMVTTPLLASQKNFQLRMQAFKYLCAFFCVIAFGSFICYFLGLNFVMMPWVTNSSNGVIMSPGTFGGLTMHSMLLGPMAALAMIYCSYKVFFPDSNRKTYVTYIYCALIAEMLLTTLLSASRGALGMGVVGVAVVIFVKYRGHLGKFAGVIGIIFLAASFLLSYNSSFSVGMKQKQQANEEAGGTFASRQYKLQNRIDEFEQNPIFGIGPNVIAPEHNSDYTPFGNIEPGSSWMAVFSMTGLAGACTIAFVLIPTLRNLYVRAKQRGGEYALLFASLVAFCMHMFVEGYIFSGGSYLCFTFWLTLGLSYTMAKSR